MTEPPEPDAPEPPDPEHTEDAPDEETAAAVRQALLAHGADVATRLMGLLHIPNQN